MIQTISDGPLAAGGTTVVQSYGGYGYGGGYSVASDLYAIDDVGATSPFLIGNINVFVWPDVFVTGPLPSNGVVAPWSSVQVNHLIVQPQNSTSYGIFGTAIVTQTRTF